MLQKSSVRAWSPVLPLRILTHINATLLQQGRRHAPRTCRWQGCARQMIPASEVWLARSRGSNGNGRGVVFSNGLRYKGPHGRCANDALLSGCQSHLRCHYYRPFRHRACLEGENARTGCGIRGRIDNVDCHVSNRYSYGLGGICDYNDTCDDVVRRRTAGWQIISS